MKVLKKIVAIGAMACMCVALGGTKVAEAAACTHDSRRQVGSSQYSKTEPSHYVVPCVFEPVIRNGLLEWVPVPKYDEMFLCYSTVYYSDVVEICNSCGAVTDTWVEKTQYDHTHCECPFYTNKPIRERL